MSISPVNCVFASGYCNDDGAGNEGGCVASFLLDGNLYAPLQDIVIHEDWTAVLDVERSGNTLYVLTGAGDRHPATDGYWYPELRIYAVDVSDPTNMTVLPGYVVVNDYVRVRFNVSRFGYFAPTDMQATDRMLMLGVCQGYIRNQAETVWQTFVQLRIDEAWPPTDDEAAGGASSYPVARVAPVGWQLNTRKTALPAAIIPIRDDFPDSLWRTPERFVGAEPGAEREYIPNRMMNDHNGAVGYAGDYGFYIDRGVVVMRPPGIGFTFDGIKTFQRGELDWYLGETLRWPQYQVAHAHEVGDDVLCWIGREDYLVAFSAEAENFVHGWSRYNANDATSVVDMDTSGTWVAVKLRSSAQLPLQPFGRTYVEGFLCFDASALPSGSTRFSESMKGVIAWGGAHTGEPAAQNYDIEWNNWGIVAGTPVVEAFALDTYTDPTGIEWTVLLQGNSIKVLRPDTTSTYAPPVTVDGSGLYDSVSITGDGTYLTVEARRTSDQTLWRWRSQRYGLTETWGDPSEVATA